MKKLLLGFLLTFVHASYSAETPHGSWSSEVTIVQISSYWGWTSFKVSDASSCGGGGDGFWKLGHSQGNVDATTYKKSILLTAFAGGNTVKLRCENSYISDFVVKQ